MKLGLISTVLFLVSSSVPSLDAALKGLKPDDVYLSGPKKTNVYVRDGLYVGGDRSIKDVVVLGVRLGKKQGYERVVLDLEGTTNGEPSALPRPPYYQLEVSPTMKRLVMTVWGDPKLEFDARAVFRNFKKSKAVDQVRLYPQLDSDRWTFALNLKEGYSAEVFELSNPVRVIVDIKTQ